MRIHKKVLTTGEVARICSVAPRTVSKWFDSGQLRGYRIPGSKDRRIPLDHLVRFMKAHGLPLNGLASNAPRILVADGDTDLTDLLHHALTEHDFDVRVAGSAFEAGAQLEQFHPNLMLLDVDLPGLDRRSVARYLAGSAELAEIQVIALSASLTEGDRQAMIQQGFADTLAKPFHIRQVLQLIDETLAVGS